jgi:arylsulfatase A-like enzyme
MPIGRVSDVFATSVDVFPTFLAAAGVKEPSHAVMDGTVPTLLIAMTIVMGIPHPYRSDEYGDDEYDDDDEYESDDYTSIFIFYRDIHTATVTTGYQHR